MFVFLVSSFERYWILPCSGQTVRKSSICNLNLQHQQQQKLREDDEPSLIELAGTKQRKINQPSDNRSISACILVSATRIDCLDSQHRYNKQNNEATHYRREDRFALDFGGIDPNPLSCGIFHQLTVANNNLSKEKERSATAAAGGTHLQLRVHCGLGSVARHRVKKTRS